MNKKLSVGFIGLGLMGNPMAKNIIKAGFPLTVYNRTQQKGNEFASLGATIATSPRFLAEHVDVVITIVTAAKDVEEVLFSEHGVVSSGNKHLTVVDMSTIGPTATKSIAQRLSNAGIDFLDAPVTGGTYGAQSGELTIFIGGKEAVFEKVKPLLLSMGNNIHFMGAIGNGQAIKLINNFIIASSMATLSEGMVFADVLGLPRAAVADALKTVAGVSPMMNKKMQNYVSGEYPMNFTIRNMHKDVSLAIQELGGKQSLSVMQLIYSLYEKAAKSELADSDYSQIIDIIEKK
jgi:3-hydroxyisobutyrate dehydrogenase-like beta-hydroxyacid dehydrogenase